tara:strand:+ start:394 stop:1086 length:693 start_codon:yes stop_codon:yes gene_type:complete
MELKEQILKALGLSSEVKFEVQAKLVDGTIIVSTADALAEGVDISVLTEDGTTIELPIGEYETEDGVTFVVEEAGVIATIGEAEVVEEEEAPAEEEVVEAEEEVAAEEEDEKSKYEALEKRIEYLESVIEEMKGGAEVEEELSEETTEDVETTEPSENPRTVTTKTTEVVEFSVEELKAENEKLKEELAKQPADTSLNTNKFSSEKRTLSKQDLRRMTSQEKYLYNLYNN